MNQGGAAGVGSSVAGSAGAAGQVGGQTGGDPGVPLVPSGPVTHRVLSSISHNGPLAIVDKQGHIEWQYDVLKLGDEANDAWYLPNGDVAYAYKNGAQQLTQAKTVVWNYSAPAGSEVQSCQPLPNGHFLIAEAHDGGVGYLRELDVTGQVQSTVTIDVGQNVGAHGQFRQVRKTAQNTYLTSYNGLNKSREYDAQGQLLREFPCGAFAVVRLTDGNTLLSCYDHVVEVDPRNEVVWQVAREEISGNPFGFVGGLQRLPNGNTVLVNWPGHPIENLHRPQAFELTRDKQVVWTLDVTELGWVSNLEVLDAEAMFDGVALR